jgi:hypothetical protein
MVVCLNICVLIGEFGPAVTLAHFGGFDLFIQGVSLYQTLAMTF